MNKIKKLLVGVVLGLVLTCVACTTMSSLNKISTSTSSYYSLCDFDFIIPSPWYSQVKEIKNKNFVSSIVPYFVMKKKITGNGKSSDVNLFFIEQSYGLQNTAYSNPLLSEGESISSTTAEIFFELLSHWRKYSKSRSYCSACRFKTGFNKVS